MCNLKTDYLVCTMGVDGVVVWLYSGCILLDIKRIMCRNYVGNLSEFDSNVIYLKVLRYLILY